MNPNPITDSHNESTSDMSSSLLEQSGMSTNGITRKNINLAKVKRLASSFKERILDLETEIESGEFDADQVDKLFELYEQAVEFYNLQND